MKLWKCLLAFTAGAAICMLTACSGQQQADAGVLFREAKSGAETMKSCKATISSSLVFTANGKQHTFQSSGDIIYAANPFALKSVQSSQDDAKKSSSESYTVTENGSLWFYCKNSSGWQKTGAGNLDTSPLSQIDILRLLNNAQEEKYVRQTTCGSQKVHKIELKLKSEALRSTIENIVTASGMAGNSKTIVQTLLDSAPSVYSYCYINADNGQLVHLELDAADTLNHIFQNIDGSTVTVNVSKCQISGDISNIGNAPAIILPQEAKSASSVQALG